MGNLRPEFVEETLASLLQAFGTRAWQGPFNRHDIAAVLKCGRRTAQAVAEEGSGRGLFAPNTYGYQLTSAGQRRVREVSEGARDRGGERNRREEKRALKYRPHQELAYHAGYPPCTMKRAVAPDAQTVAPGDAWPVSRAWRRCAHRPSSRCSTFPSTSRAVDRAKPVLTGKPRTRRSRARPRSDPARTPKGQASEARHRPGRGS